MNKLQFKKYTEQQLREAIKTSFSIKECLRKLNVTEDSGGNYNTFHSYVKQLNLDTSHFTGQLWNKSRILGPKYPLDDYLTNKRYITSHKLRKRLIKDKIFNHQCQSCNNITWLNKPIPIELHHKNGIHTDNSISNLELLCPNCHTLTDTYKGKNRKNRGDRI